MLVQHRSLVSLRNAHPQAQTRMHYRSQVSCQASPPIDAQQMLPIATRYSEVNNPLRLQEKQLHLHPDIYASRSRMIPATVSTEHRGDTAATPREKSTTGSC